MGIFNLFFTAPVPPGVRSASAGAGRGPVCRAARLARALNPSEAARGRAGGGGAGEAPRGPVPARASCADKMAAKAGRSIWNPGEGEWRKWPPEQ